MKCRILVPAFLACGLLFGGAARAQELLAWWDFEDGSGGTASDISGNGWHGTLTDFHNTSAGAGNDVGSSGWSDAGALNFDGRSLDNTTSGDTVRTQLPFSMLAGRSFTIETIVAHNFPQTNWAPYFGQSGGCCFFFGRRDVFDTPTSGISPIQRLHFNLNGLGGGDSSAVPIADGNPHHIALTFNDATDTINVYFDYANVYSQGGFGGTLNAGAIGTMWLGGVAHNQTERWNGYAWDTRVIVDSPGVPESGVLPVEAFLPLDAASVPAESPQGSSVNFANFGDTSRFFMRGTAGKYENGTNNAPDDDRIRLTARQHGGQAGAAWLNGTVHFPQANLAFNTHFTFEMTEGAGNDGQDGVGADGMHFVIQNAGTRALGWAGGGMGVQDIGTYVSVELDTWPGGVHDVGGTNGSHIAINMSGVGASIAQNPPAGMPGMPRFNDGGLHHVWVDYDGTTMDVYFSTTDTKPATPWVSAAIDLATHFGGVQDLYVGFTGATGGAFNNHDVVAWQFNAVPEPSTYALLSIGVVGLLAARRRMKK